MGRASVPTPALYPAFFFVLEKGSKSAGNAVISTLLMHRSHGLQHLRHKRPTFAFVGESGYTRHPSPEPRTQRLTRRNRWRFGWGWYHYPRSVPHVSETLRGRGLKRQTLPLLGLGRGCSQRTQRAFGTAMRLCASLFRGATAPLGCVILSLVFQHCVLLLSMWNSHTTQTDWYHHSRLVLHAVEPPTSGHQNGPLIVYCSVWQILY